jgi:AcrR family transcriptional regulator
MKLFAKDGLERVTLRDIAKDADVLLGTIFHYFPQKNALRNAALTEAYEGRSRQIRAALSVVGTPEDRLRSLIRDLLSRFEKDDPYLRLVERNNADGGAKFVGDAVRANWRENYKSLAAIVSELTKQPIKTSKDPRIAFVFSVIFGFAKMHREYDGILKLKKNIRDAASIDELLAFIKKGISAP